MHLTRRTFLAAAGGSVVAALGGCEQLTTIAGVPRGLRDAGSFAMPTGESADAVTHVLNRLTFGPRPGDRARVATMGVEAFIEEQLEPETIDDSGCERLTRRLETLHLAPGDLFEFKEEVLRRELTQNAVLRATYSRQQLQEVMVEFWTDHFNIDMSKGDCPWLKAHDDRQVIRKHALGSFPAMLKASALSPAMLWYLDGRSNRRRNDEDRPNENYARELLELHTLGVDGGYTQQDVMEAARCLTGWTVRSEELFGKGRVEFNADGHDRGAKRVLGQHIPPGQGARDVDLLLQIVASHPATAQHVATKLCRRFIGAGVHPAAVIAVADAFQASSGDIRKTLRTLFQTPEFTANRGSIFKRPFRFMVSALRASNAELRDVGGIYDYLLRMGHAPYQYPTPDGYPDEAHPWYGTMLWRWHFALALAENRVPGVNVNWNALREAFEDEQTLTAHLLGRAAAPEEAEVFTAAHSLPAVVLGAPGFQWC